MRSIYCPIHMHNKYKPDKFCDDLFILEFSKYYFIYHLDVYQENNSAYLDILPKERGTPTTPKAVANTILKTKIKNDTNIFRYILLANIYAPQQLLKTMNCE